MFGIASKILLFLLGQKLTRAVSHTEPKGLVAPAMLAALSLIFFAQGLAALLIAGFFWLTSMELPNYFAALAISGMALVVSLIFGFALRAKLCGRCGEEKEEAADFDPRPLVSAFLDGFLARDNRAARTASYFRRKAG